MKYLYLLLFFCFSSWTISAQEKNTRTEIRNYFDFKAGETAYLFGDKVNIRADATTDAEILKTAAINTPVKILVVLPAETNPFLTLKGITAPWVKIQFGKNQTDGYVWAPLLAQYKMEGAFYEDFLFGLSRKDPKTGQLYGKLRAIKEGYLLDELEIKVIGNEEHHAYGHIFDNRGIPKVDNIIELHFGYEACGYANGNQTVVWQDEQLFYLGKTEGISEAGVFFGGRTLVFPNDEGGQSKKVLIEEENGEFDEIGNGTITKKISVWDWTDTKLVKATSY